MINRRIKTKAQHFDVSMTQAAAREPISKMDEPNTLPDSEGGGVEDGLLNQENDDNLW